MKSNEVPVIALPLRVGLAVAEGLEIGLPALADVRLKPYVKWPNDIIIAKHKVAGILCEACNGWILIGVGINCVKRAFPPELRRHAGSLSNSIGQAVNPDEVLAMVLSRLITRLSKSPEEEKNWRSTLESRLYNRGHKVSFLIGDPERNERVQGMLAGLAPDGRLVLELSNPSRQESFASGELIFEDEIDGHTEPSA
jgi:BirA family biotin operon repressor/biotin-[acetyl-CoA-carboxylase] ligase